MVAGGAERDLHAVEAQDAIPRARLLDVVGGHQQAAALGGEIVEQRAQALGAGRVHARERLVEQQQRGVLDERPRDEHALALTAGEIAEGPLGAVRQADALERVTGERAVGSRRAPPPRHPRDGAHQRHVERADREIQARALGLGHERDAPGGQRKRTRGERAARR